ncbi:hypothetical protein CS022_02185 [Veronia nyctiphanis]|uniref:Inosine/uridine-preferring nucleoside hydrolase domain-containing protein n=1 Tax=Veronia nyctiphanis TaxID=1278244 RepID=A0A4Q0YT92_9GAMM|nr:nucleoside hydrolase [Veronia nyctiphanis]RXJ74437.1 hypothetical protein CS022_02185 [Veronia nyctiphanis]
MPTTPLNLWIDTDITVGAKKISFLHYKDVDDGYALGSLMHSPEVEIVGISSTRANTLDINESTSIAKRFVRDFGSESYSVYKGSSSTFDCTRAELPEAVVALIDALEKSPLTILAIGAFTNLAILLHARPDLASRIERVVAVAGRESVNETFISGSYQRKPFRDLNFEFDVSAFNVVVQSGVEVDLVPFSVCKQVWVDLEELLALRVGNPMARFLAEHTFGWWLEWEVVFGARKGFNPFDMVAAAYMINRDWFTTEGRKAKIVEAPSDTDEGKIKPYLVCSSSNETGHPVRYCTGINTDQISTLMLSRISSSTVETV